MLLLCNNFQISFGPLLTLDAIEGVKDTDFIGRKLFSFKCVSSTCRIMTEGKWKNISFMVYWQLCTVQCSY